MSEIEKRIYVCDEILNHEFDYLNGSLKDVKLVFRYYKPKTDKTTCHILGTYRTLLAFSRIRARDGRYKNYEFLISLS